MFITDPINKMMKVYGGVDNAEQTFNHTSIRSGVPSVVRGTSNWYAIYYASNGTYMGWSSVEVSRKVSRNAKEAGFISDSAKWKGYIISDPKQLANNKVNPAVVMRIFHRQLDPCSVPISDEDYKKELLHNIKTWGVPHTAGCYDPRGLLADLAKKEEEESQALVKKYKELAKELLK
mgnify:CR=1 FL=1